MAQVREVEIQMHWMTRDFLPAVQRIAAQANSACQNLEFLEHLGKRFGVNGKVALLAPESDEPDTTSGFVEFMRGPVVVGFSFYRVFKDEFSLIDLVVDADHRRRGYGTFMLEDLLNRLTPVKRPKLTAVVPETNAAALAFFKYHGLESKLVRGHFQDLDGVEFTKTRLGDP